MRHVRHQQPKLIPKRIYLLINMLTKVNRTLNVMAHALIISFGSRTKKPGGHFVVKYAFLPK